MNVPGCMLSARLCFAHTFSLNPSQQYYEVNALTYILPKGHAPFPIPQLVNGGKSLLSFHCIIYHTGDPWMA